MSAIKRKYSTPNAFARYAVKIGIALFFVCCYIIARGLPQGKAPISAQIFDQVRNVPAANRVKYADSVYKNTFRKTDAETAMAALDKLRQVSIDLNDKPLECAVFDMRADYDSLRSQFYEQTGNPVQALAYRKMYEIDRDSLVNRNNVAAVERVKLHYEADKRIAALSKATTTERVQLVEIRAGIAVLILLVVISLLLYNRQRLASKKDKELLMAEKKVVDEELRFADIALRGFTENLQQKNLLIEKFKTEIDQLNKRTVGNDNAGQLEKLLQAHIMTDQNWNDFKKLFAKVYPGFFVNISKQYPHLSATDTRLLALIKLGLNNAEMANMLGITVEGIKKAKQRLRKKIDIQAVEAIKKTTKE